MSARVLCAAIAERIRVRRVKNPSNGVVQGLGLGERLVSALVRKDPQAGADEAIGEAVQRPEGEPSEGVEVGVREGDVFRGDPSIRKDGCFVDAVDEEEVVNPIRRCVSLIHTCHKELTETMLRLTHSSSTGLPIACSSMLWAQRIIRGNMIGTTRLHVRDGGEQVLDGEIGDQEGRLVDGDPLLGSLLDQHCGGEGGVGLYRLVVMRGARGKGRGWGSGEFL